MSQSSQPEYSIDVITGDSDNHSLMFKDENSGQIYEAEKVSESEYVIGLFGTLNESVEESSILERLEAQSSDDLEEIAHQLVEKYDDPKDPLRERKDRRLQHYRDMNLYEKINPEFDQDSREDDTTHSNSQIGALI